MESFEPLITTHPFEKFQGLAALGQRQAPHAHSDQVDQIPHSIIGAEGTRLTGQFAPEVFKAFVTISLIEI